MFPTCRTDVTTKINSSPERHKATHTHTSPLRPHTFPQRTRFGYISWHCTRQVMDGAERVEGYCGPSLEPPFSDRHHWPPPSPSVVGRSGPVAGGGGDNDGEVEVVVMMVIIVMIMMKLSPFSFLLWFEIGLKLVRCHDIHRTLNNIGLLALANTPQPHPSRYLSKFPTTYLLPRNSSTSTKKHPNMMRKYVNSTNCTSPDLEQGFTLCPTS